jgi:hypothetical protein
VTSQIAKSQLAFFYVAAIWWPSALPIKSWPRRDKYEKHIKLYWVETKLGGKALLLL